MQAKERSAPAAIDPGAAREDSAGPGRPLLMVDIDGVISLFGAVSFDGTGWGEGREGSLHSIEGIPHFLSSKAAAHLLGLSGLFDLVWASGWEEKAGEHLPRLLGFPADIPHLTFSRAVGRSNAHWKLDAIDEYAGGRPVAWVDDALNDECHEWALARPAPTLLVQTVPEQGLTAAEAGELERWARRLALN